MGLTTGVGNVLKVLIPIFTSTLAKEGAWVKLDNPEASDQQAAFRKRAEEFFNPALEVDGFEISEAKFFLPDGRL